MKATLPLHRRSRVWYGVRRDAATADAAHGAVGALTAPARIRVPSLYGRDLPAHIRRAPTEPSAEIL